MNLYRITYNGIRTQYIVANSFQGVYDTWHSVKDRFEIEQIEVLEFDIKIEKDGK